MDAILVINAGSSSVKFQIFGVTTGNPERLVKGQVDGIGTRPRLRAAGRDGTSLIDISYAPHEVGDVPAAISATADWLRETQEFELVAVGHRVVTAGHITTALSSSIRASYRNWRSTARLLRCISRTI